jgi:hypothetical protein
LLFEAMGAQIALGLASLSCMVGSQLQTLFHGD